MKVSLFQGILIGIFVLSAIVGVFVFATYRPGQGPENIGDVVIWGELPQSRVSDYLDDAGLVDPRLKDVSYVERPGATIADDLVRAIADGRAPDMVLISQENLLGLTSVLQLIPEANITERQFKDSFIAGSEVYRAPGGTYGIPFLVDPLVLFTNRTTLDSNGIASAPTTWEAITGLVGKLTTKTPGGNIARATIALGTYQNIRNARGILSALFLQAGAPIVTRTSSGSLRADLGAERIEGSPPGASVLLFYTQFADPARIYYTWNASLGNSQTEFSAGDLALYLGYASEAKHFKDANPNLNFDVAPLPQLATGGAKITYGQIYGFAIPRGSKNVSGALKTALALAGGSLNQGAASATGLAPANRTNLGAKPADATASVAYTSALYVRGWLSPAPADTDAVFSTMINNVISGRLLIENAIGAAEGALANLIRR